MMDADATGTKGRFILMMSSGATKTLEVPSGYKMTFGPLVPGVKAAGAGGGGATLRLYEGKDIKAAICGVQSFWQESIRIEDQPLIPPPTSGGAPF